MTKQLLAIVITACTLWGCSNSKTSEKLNADSLSKDSLTMGGVKTDTTKMGDQHNSMNSVDWDGIYKGIVPCADCEGIETTIVLGKELTYSIKTKYLGKSDAKVFEEKGKFSWDKSGQIITLNDIKDGPNKYFVGENKIIQLDMEGKEITGKLADHYVLKK
ncbi:putative lipoprotein NlpE involved in copper resistance [Pedobacter cryoconitis]|uniref:Putative lipoprotein NlpE involved in copper resistance n=1 Tax=Pedobacter cryoconitis TaxID=188932 RepID=A0A7W8ZJ60_9SPHI|nr:copper resistance protein NlpE [Pedobacter cryoconitis]MBB5634923.1 putative lipoprotein NlpE involved in copper resistance [Pedobacter cryoconitis]MBB6271944.1 putative lipoprotein NlpE involved in copper resistance [Pedobacter cryoconitis]